jgi:hypothetical protein
MALRAPLQGQERTRAVLDQRFGFASRLDYTVGSYSEMEGGLALILPVAGRWRLDAAYAEHGGNDRVTAALSRRWPVAAQLELHVGVGGFWLPPNGFLAERHRLGPLALAGIERGPSPWLHGLGIDTWVYAEVQALTQRTVHVPVAAGLRFAFRRPPAPAP